ncbi:hypothetical protein D3C86_1265340 [compost metagenome]
MTRGVPQADATLHVAHTALMLAPKPKTSAEVKPWLMDGYSRVLKAKSAQQMLEGDKSANSRKVGELTMLIWDVERQLARLDKGDAVKKEFFAGILPPAQQIIDGLAKYPAPPADKDGKAKWLGDAKQELARAKAADDLLNTAWIEFKAVGFDQRTDASDKLHAFEARVRKTEYELNPPAPRPAGTAAKPATTPGTSAPVFGLTQGASELANSKNPAAQSAGAAMLPIAVTIDLIDLITRPLAK